MTISNNNNNKDNNKDNNGSISNSEYSRNNPNSSNTNRLLLYFIIIIGIIAIFVWTVFLIQISQLLESNVKQDVVANQTQSLINQTQLLLHEDQARLNQTIHEDMARAKQAEQILNQTRILIIDHQNASEEYIDKANNTTQKLLAKVNDAQIQHDIIIERQGNTTTETNTLMKTFFELLGIDPEQIIIQKEKSQN